MNNVISLHLIGVKNHLIYGVKATLRLVVAICAIGMVMVVLTLISDGIYGVKQYLAPERFYALMPIVLAFFIVVTVLPFFLITWLRVYASYKYCRGKSMSMRQFYSQPEEVVAEIWK